ncbi:glycosyltransferase [Bacillus licheniformis]|nr:glycosyltransferase [Bacillus licheniformis]
MLSGFKNIHEWIQLADVSVASSIREGLGMNLLEGMASGKPAVAVDNRGHREVIQEGVNGFWFRRETPERSATGYCSCTVCLLCEKDGRRGETNSRRFSQQRTVKEMAGIYSSFMDNETVERRLKG